MKKQFQCNVLFYRSIEQKMAKLNWHDIIPTWHETHAPMQSNIAFHFPLSHFLQPWNCKSSYEKGQIEDLQNWLERPSSENDLNAAQQLKSSISSRAQISTLKIWIRCYLRCWWTHAWKSQSFLHSNYSVNLRPHFCMSSCAASLSACPHIRNQIDICRGLNHSMPLTKMLPNSFVTRGTYLQTG